MLCLIGLNKFIYTGINKNIYTDVVVKSSNGLNKFIYTGLNKFIYILLDNRKLAARGWVRWVASRRSREVVRLVGKREERNMSCYPPVATALLDLFPA